MKTKHHVWFRLLSVLVAVILVLPMGSVLGVIPMLTAKAADVWDGTWDGSGFSGNHITSAKGLAQFINNCGTGTSYSGQTVYLDVDIDLNNIDFGNISGGKNVYYSRDNYFQGTFDGQEHTIYNFQMHNSDHRIGLFRSARNATFRNVNFENVFIDDNDNNRKNGFAALVGLAEGNLTFENVHVKSGTVYGYNYVGGLVGEYSTNDTIRFTNCSNAAMIYADNDRAAGMVGHSKGRVYATNCSNSGEIYAGYSDAGGIAGWIEDDESYFVNCSNTGKVSTDACAGGIFGYFGSKSNDNKMTLNNCSNTGYIESRAKCAGGIAGWMETDGAHTITGCVNRGEVYGRDDVGGIVGINSGSGVWENNRNYGYVHCNNDNCGGIVGELEDDKQTFLNCQNAGEISGKNSTGGIVGWLNNAAEDEFNRCFNTGNITSTNSYAGGIAGRGNKMITCVECFNIGNVQGSNDSGGLVGSIDYHTFFYRCFNAGSVTAPSGKSAGGMIGYTSYNGGNLSSQQVVDCYNWGTISAENAGGLVGWVDGGSAHYHVANSYNTGSINGTSKAWQFVGNGGTCDGNCYKIVNSGSGTYKTGDEFETFDFTISSNFCKNTWGVRIGSTTYKYPILTWYRNLFQFESKFVDSATGTNQTITKNYGESFTVPNPTRPGYSAGQWLSGNTHRLVRGQTVTAGNTYLMNTNYDKNAGPADTNTVVQSFSEPTEVKSTRTYGLIWNAGAAANMYATSWANEENNTNSRYRAGIDYTIYNLTTGHDVVYTDGSASDYTSGNSQYFKSYQRNGTGAATATLEVDRSKMDDIKDTGVYIDYYPFIYTGPGGVRWGVEIFDPNNADSKGVLNNDHWQATVTGQSGKTYTYEQRFNDVNGSDHRCAETSSDFTQEPSGTAAAERRYGSYKWYFKGAAPDAGDSVTLRITAICAARYNSGNLQILSEWTDLTIIGTCTHSNGHLHAVAANAATCTEPGNSAYWYCDVCGKYFSDAAATNEIAQNSWILPAMNHAWGQPSYVWAEDNASVTATRICANDPTNHIETETVQTDYSVINDAQCGVAGSGKYTTKVFSNPAFTVQTKTVDIPALEHDWNTPTYDWTDDGHSVTATRTCNNGNHPETETRMLGNGVTAAVKTPANCNEMGWTTYSATFINSAFEQQSKDVQDIPTNNDHAWGAWTKLDDEKHQRVCEYNPAHVETEAHTGGTATCEEKAACTVCGARYGEYAAHRFGEWVPAQAATCSAAGHVGYYFCSVCEKYFDAEYNEIADIVLSIDPDAHSYGDWTKMNDEKHQRVCAYDPAHVETEDHAWNETGSQAATCIAYGSVSYTCSVCGAVKTETGSAYSSHTFTAQRAEEEYLASAATCIAPARYYYACAVCGLSENDPAHTFENGEPDTVNGHQLTHYAAKAPTCTAVGWDAYDTCALCTYTTYVEIPATGHTYTEPAAEDWIWTRSGDTFTATVTVSCEHNDDSQILTASVSLAEDVPATADADGYQRFTAVATVGEGENQQTFTAEKSLTFYYVSVAAGTGVIVSGAETGSYEAGTVLTVSAAADTGYDQSEPALYVNGVEAENPAEITVNAPVAITTNDLPLNTYTLTWMDQWGNVLTTATGSYGWATSMPLDDPADVRIGSQVWTFDHWDNGKTAGQNIPYSSAAQTPVITAIYRLTDQVAKYTVRFLNDDNYTVLSTAEYEYNAAVVIPGTPVSTNRTKELDYTFLGWTPEVAGTVTADATYVATYETEAHSRIYPVQWVYNDGTEVHVVKEENLPYDTVFTAADLPADVIVRDDAVSHYIYSWANWAETELSYHIGYGTTEVSIYANYSTDRHEGTPEYEWVGTDADGYTKCIATMTCTDCGEELRVEYTLDEDDVYTHTGEHCQDQSYTTYRAWIAGSGVNSYFENKTKTVYGGYGDHFYPSSSVEVVWNTEDVHNVTCKVTQTCYYCGHVEEDPGEVSVYEQTPATCASPEKTVFVAEFERWSDQYSEEIETAPIDGNAHKYDGWNVRPDEARSTRPVYSAETDTWSKGTLVIPCANTYTLDYNYDPETGGMTVLFNYTVDDYAAHDKVLTDLDRADYDAFDEALEKFRTISALDIADDTVIYAETYGDETYETTFGQFKDMYFDRMLASAEQFPQNLVTIPEGAEGHEFDEQPHVDDMTEQMQMTLELFFNEDGTPKEELLNHYTVTFTLKDDTVTSYNKINGAVVEVPAAPAEVDGYAFLGWTLDGSTIALAADAATYTVTGDAAFTAKYADTPANCTVTFLNADDTELASVTVAYGAALSEADIPAIPEKEADAEYHYSGAWDGEIVTTVTVDAIYKVVYTSEAHTGGTATCKEKAACTVCGTSYGELAAHTYGEWTEEEAATCSAEGHVGYYFCSVCEKYFDVEYNVIADIVLSIDPDAHSYGAWTKLDDNEHQRVCANDPSHVETADHEWQQTGTTPATCIAEGTTSFKCTVCDATKTETGAYGDHAYGEWIAEVPAKCEAAGVKGHYHCAVCGKDFDTDKNEIEDLAIPQLGHDWGGWTKLNDDQHQRVCANDETHVQTEDHDWRETGATDATCIAAGTVSYECSVCGAEKTETGVFGDHTWGAWAELNENEHQRVCTTDPSHTETEDHDWRETGATDATCIAAGTVSYECSVCGAEKTETGVFGDHTWGAWTELNENEHQRVCTTDPSHTETEDHDWRETGATDATCIAAGTVSFECSVCGAEKTETGAFGSHSLTFVPAVAGADCEHTGTVAYYVCAVCGETFADAAGAEAITDLSDHTFGAHTPGAAVRENEVPAACTVAGYYESVVFCAVCGAELSRTPVLIPALGHSWSAWSIVQAATFTEDGLEQRTCARCGETEERTLKWSGEKDRMIQFVVSGSMHYVVHMEDADYLIYSRTTPAIYWYKEAPLTFTVEPHAEWNGGCIVSLNGNELLPNADGTYTIPAGADYVKINCYPSSAAENGAGHTDTCPFCGKVHPSSLWGRLVAFFHLIMYFFKNLFHR